MEICKCGNLRCTGFHLLHPKELAALDYIKKKNREVCKDRTFNLVDSPSSGEIFTKFKELHVIAGPDEDMDNLEEPKVETAVIQERIKAKEELQKQMRDFLASMVSDKSDPSQGFINYHGIIGGK